MKSKKLILAIAIFGGMLFTAQATNIIDLDGQAKTEIKKKKNVNSFKEDDKKLSRSAVIGSIVATLIALTPFIYVTRKCSYY